MILSVSGYNCSGSSAIVHLLKEYDETVIIDFECMILDLPDGIKDLDYAFHANGSYFREDRAFLRFQKMIHNHRYMQKLSKKRIDEITSAYIENLTGVTWKGRSVYDYAYNDRFERYAWFGKRLIEKFAYKCKKTRMGLTNRSMRMKAPECDFYQLTKSYMDEIILSFGGNLKKINVMDQIMPPVGTKDYFKYLNHGRAIIVDRDPRDMYLNLRLGVDCRCTPITVKEFVEYHRIWWESDKEASDDSRILRINFEDLIYMYDETRRQIEEFLGLKKTMRKGTVFHPERSVNNTQIFRRISGYEKDIEYIEQKLEDHLYPFPENHELDLKKEYKYQLQTLKTNDKKSERVK